ncbi:MAG: tetratricopeptide repeat protein [Chloroflexi bacterium]|nr:tetratricopeptide repeat protein [Chloroflexota bacterium]
MTLLGNRYQLHEKLGEGGMGAVYRATDRLTGQSVALKRVLIPTSTSAAGSSPDTNSSRLRLSLAREFQTLASLRHPNVIGVEDYGFDTAQQPYFTMTLLEKPQTILEAGAKATLDQKIDLLIQLLQALAYLHRRGILHRDLKPANVLVEDGKTVRVLDFGLATAQEQQTGEAVEGTVTYMAPEVISRTGASKPADLYAVGVMAYELFTGRYPFDTTNINKLIRSVFYTEPDLKTITSLTAEQLANIKTRPVKPDVAISEQVQIQWVAHQANDMPSQDLAAIVGKLMAKDPKARYQSAQDVINELYQVIGQPVYEESQAVRESFLQAASFVGRDEELGMLSAALLNAIEGHGSAWLVGGESGVGKSRLLDELRTQSLVDGAMVIRGQTVAEGGLPYQLWRDPIRRLVLSTDLSDIEAGILKEILPDIGSLIGREIPDAPVLEGKARQQRLNLAIIDLFRKQKQPTLLLLEDLHWAGVSLQPLKLLAESAKQLPLLVVGSYRHDEMPELPGELPGVDLINLNRLSETSIADLSVSMLGEAGNQPEVLAFLQRETEGNVFFMIETVRALAEEAGHLQAVGGMQLPEQIFAGGIQQIIQRRLGRVPEIFHALLKLAAVIGRRLDFDLLAQLDDKTDLEAWLNICANVAVFDRQDEQWRFAHDKLREALLKDLNTNEEVTLHRQVAEAIETTYPNDKGQAVNLMEHWHHAGEISKEANYAQIAGEQALSISNSRGAIDLYNRALKLISEDKNAVRAVILVDLAKSHENLSDYTTATKYLNDGLALARSASDQLMMVKALNALGLVTEMQGAYDDALKLNEQALDIARTIADRAGTASALKNLGNIARLRGDYDNAKKYYEESLAIRTELNDKQGMAVCLNNLGLTYYFQGNMEEAKRCLTEALDIHKQIGARFETAAGLGNLGVITAQWGDTAAAKQYFEESMVTRREIGDRAGQASMLTNLGMLAKDAKDFDEAHRYFKEGLTIRREIGDRAGIANSLINLGVVAKGHKLIFQAEKYLHDALKEAKALEAIPLMLETMVELAGLQVENGQYAQAAEWLGMVVNHPALDTGVKMAAEPILTDLGQKFPTDQLNPALERGKQLRLDFVVDELLRLKQA